MCKKIQSNEGRKAVANMATFITCATKLLWTLFDAEGSNDKLLWRTSPHPTCTGKSGWFWNNKFSFKEPQQFKGTTLKQLFLPLYDIVLKQ